MEFLRAPSSDVRNGLVIERGSLAGQYFRVQYHVCVNPVCQCDHIGMQCALGSDSPSGSGLFAPICLEMDLRQRSIANLKKLEADPNAFALAKAIADEISEEQWETLSWLYVAEKQRQTEQADLDQVEVHFPPEVLAGDGSVVAYYELFPYARRIAATLDGVPWILDDQYCVNPTCRCREAFVSFLQGHSAPVFGVSCVKEEIAIRYAYDKGETTQSLVSKASGPSAHDILSQIKDARPDLDTILAERHALLRRLFRRAKAETKPHVPTKKLGRNDPCPCGSGKKYKRCCGAD